MMCLECYGSGIIITCCDDLCVGGDHCIHGDGEEFCPECQGAGFVPDVDEDFDFDETAALDIEQIPIQELIDDRAASLADIEVCKLAILHGIQNYSGGSTQKRLDINQGIVDMIDKELVRREV
jgi:hypothetical protein